MTTQNDKKRTRLFVLNEPVQLRISTALAMEIGFNESIMLLQLEYLITISTTQVIDGDLWMYDSIQNMRSKWFPFWSVATIWRVLQSLNKKGLIKIGNFNKTSFDRTSWFCLDEKGIAELKSVRLDTAIFQNEKSSRSKRKMDLIKMKNGSFNLQNPFDQNEMTIPKIPTEIPTKIPTEIPSSSQRIDIDNQAPSTTRNLEEVLNVYHGLPPEFVEQLRAVGFYDELLPKLAGVVYEGAWTLEELKNLLPVVKKKEPEYGKTAALFWWRVQNTRPGKRLSKEQQDSIERESYITGEFSKFINH